MLLLLKICTRHIYFIETFPCVVTGRHVLFCNSLLTQYPNSIYDGKLVVSVEFGSTKGQMRYLRLNTFPFLYPVILLAATSSLNTKPYPSVFLFKFMFNQVSFSQYKAPPPTYPPCFEIAMFSSTTCIGLSNGI